jgi:hypothetical protein
MTNDHKRALADGRAQGRAVSRYLEALERNRPRRGRPLSAESIRTQLDGVEKKLTEAEPLQRLHLLQAHHDLTAKLNQVSARPKKDDMVALEKAFVAVAAEYGERKNLTYSTWRAVGVTPVVLDKAGIKRGRAR